MRRRGASKWAGFLCMHDDGVLHIPRLRASLRLDQFALSRRPQPVPALSRYVDMHRATYAAAVQNQTQVGMPWLATPYGEEAMRSYDCAQTPRNAWAPGSSRDSSSTASSDEDPRPMAWFRSLADFVYVPQAHVREFAELSEQMAASKVFLEFAVCPPHTRTGRYQYQCTARRRAPSLSVLRTLTRVLCGCGTGALDRHAPHAPPRRATDVRLALADREHASELLGDARSRDGKHAAHTRSTCIRPSVQGRRRGARGVADARAHIRRGAMKLKQDVEAVSL